MAKLQEINSREDIETLVNKFYHKVNQDELLSPVFNDFARVNWENHMPVMYDFWSSVLFGDQSYRGNPFLKHIPLPVDKNHFERWLKLFMETVDENFTGEKAEEAKSRATSIAGIFQYKLSVIK
jgi:hemoglobin